MNKEKKIVIFSPVLPISEDQDLGNWKEKVGEILAEHTIDVQVLESNVRNFFINITNVLESSQEVEKKGFQLDQIEFTLQIGMEGQVGFLGTSAKATGQGGIKFVIKRRG